MAARNGEHGYGWVTRTLHWLTAALVVTQFVVGYVVHYGGGPLPVHVALGITILVLATVRVLWRLTTPLPPWQESLTGTEKRVATWTERVMLGLLFVIPISGLVLRFGGDADVLVVHIVGHIAFYLALATHLALVLGRGLAGRPVLLRRMV